MCPVESQEGPIQVIGSQFRYELKQKTNNRKKGQRFSFNSTFLIARVSVLINGAEMYPMESLQLYFSPFWRIRVNNTWQLYGRVII